MHRYFLIHLSYRGFKGINIIKILFFKKYLGTFSTKLDYSSLHATNYEIDPLYVDKRA